ncbi:MAG: peptidylprolyl isomerase [Planctomycetes bacterium]|nr:peptidylprolyl isomerase [Planctomycetota bacterium]
MLLLPAGCATGGSAAAASTASDLAAGGGVAPIGRAEATSVRLAPQEPDHSSSELGPEILLPPPDSTDQEVARVGELSLTRSHAFARLMLADPKLALSAVDLLVFDVLVARHAEEHQIRVDPQRVEELAAGEEKRMREQVTAELGGEMDFPAYVFSMFGMRLDDWQRTLRLRTAQRLYQGYVIRYLALREDRVLVRFLVHRDEKIAREVYDKVRAGADFATLALRWSEDGRRDGGLLPAFGRGFPHPVAEVAFALQKGEVSAPFERTIGGEPRWFVVYCLDRYAGRDVPFAAVRAEIDRDLEQKPLTQLETSAYALRWRGATETEVRNGR